MCALVQTASDLEQLREKAEQIEGLVTPPESVEERPKGDDAVDRVQRRQAWHRRVADAVLDLSSSFPEGVGDRDVRKLLELVVEMGRLLDADPDARDADGAIELTTIRMADVARRLRRRLVHEQIDDPEVAFKLVTEGLAQIPVSEIARLLDVSTKTIRTWQQGNPVRHNASRVVVVAQLLSYLRSSMSARGAMMWFDAERDQLDGHTPLQLLAEDSARAHGQLIDLARGSRGQLAG